MLAAAGMFFVFAARRVGAIAALAPTLVLLFFGSGYHHVLSGNGFGVLFTQAAGIGALLALEREDWRGDACACLLLSVALATYSEGLAFVVGAGVLILLGADRWRRAWVVLAGGALRGMVPVVPVPVVPGPSPGCWGGNRPLQPPARPELGVQFVGHDRVIAGRTQLSSARFRLGPGHCVGGSLRTWPEAPAIADLPVSLGNDGRAGGPLADGGGGGTPPVRVPSASRYVYPTAIATLLVMAEAARGVRLQRGAITILYAVAAISLATNIALLRESAATLRRIAVVYRADLTALDLDSGRLPTIPTIAMDGRRA